MKVFWGIFVILLVGVFSFFLFRHSGSVSQKSISNTKLSKEEASSEVRNNQSIRKQYNSPPKMVIDQKKKYVAILMTTKGTMRIELFPQEAPNTVNNFVFLAREGFYNDTVFHRIIKDFMIQGGDPTGTGRGGPGYRFADEPIKRPYTRGTIAMANAGPNTNGSQFFIMHKDYNLEKNYVIFGKIPENDTESLATLDAIAQTPVTSSESGEQSKPIEKVTLIRVDIQEE